MIEIHESPTADSRTRNVEEVSRDELLRASLEHIEDVGKGLAFFSSKIAEAAVRHDYDKLTEIDWFYRNFRTKFEECEWWDNHRVIHRHHLSQDDGIPDDVNFIDVLEYITDCVMAGMARSGSVYELKTTPELLEKAFRNTVELLKAQVEVKSEVKAKER